MKIFNTIYVKNMNLFKIETEGENAAKFINDKLVLTPAHLENTFRNDVTRTFDENVVELLFKDTDNGITFSKIVSIDRPYLNSDVDEFGNNEYLACNALAGLASFNSEKISKILSESFDENETNQIVKDLYELFITTAISASPVGIQNGSSPSPSWIYISDGNNFNQLSNMLMKLKVPNEETMPADMKALEIFSDVLAEGVLASTEQRIVLDYYSLCQISAKLRNKFTELGVVFDSDLSEIDKMILD